MIRTPRRVKQRMYYALPGVKVPVYETDDEGNIIYLIIGGEQVPKEIGEPLDSYSDPKLFYNSITESLTEEELQAFGGEDRAKAKMTYRRGEYPFRAGTLIWKDSEIRHKENGLIDEESADYRVVGVMEAGQHFWRCILSPIAKDHEN